MVKDMSRSWKQSPSGCGGSALLCFHALWVPCIETALLSLVGGTHQRAPFPVDMMDEGSPERPPCLWQRSRGALGGPCGQEGLVNARAGGGQFLKVNGSRVGSGVHTGRDHALSRWRRTHESQQSPQGPQQLPA